MGLPFVKVANKDVMSLQTLWYKIINPFFSTAQSQAVLLQNVSLVSGINTVTHGLGYPLTGWSIVRKRIWENAGTITSYDVMDEQNSNLNVTVPVSGNSTPQSTLILFCTQGTATNPVVVDLEVF